MALQPQRPTGHVFRVDRKRGPVWYAKYRLPDGRQVQRKIGPTWTERGRPSDGYFTKHTAEDWLRRTLDEARRGTLPGMVKTGVTFIWTRASAAVICEATLLSVMLPSMPRSDWLIDRACACEVTRESTYAFWAGVAPC